MVVVITVSVERSLSVRSGRDDDQAHAAAQASANATRTVNGMAAWTDMAAPVDDLELELVVADEWALVDVAGMLNVELAVGVVEVVILGGALKMTEEAKDVQDDDAGVKMLPPRFEAGGSWFSPRQYWNVVPMAS